VAAPPEVPGLPLIGSLLDLRGGQVRFLRRVREEHGDIAMVRVGTFRLVVASRPEWVQHVLQGNARNYDKNTRGFNKLRMVLGNGLLTSEGAFWLRQRRMAQPAFSRTQLAALAVVMRDKVEDLANNWTQARANQGPGSVVRSIDIDMMELALAVVGETLLGRSLGSEAIEISAALEEVLGYVRWRTTVPDAVEKLPLRRNREFIKANEALDGVVRGLIADRREETTDAPDLLNRFMTAIDPETGAQMDDGQLRDEVMTMFLAGHETTANALTWTLHLLSLHPEIQQAVRDEVQEVADASDPTELRALGLTMRVLQESMRLYPPAWAVTRRSKAPDKLGEWDIEPDVFVIVSPYIVGRHPDVWPDPDRFDPDRFLPENTAERHRFAYFPFGGGPRLCIGRDFAINEALIALVILVGRFEFKPVDSEVEEVAKITLRPKGGLRLSVEVAS
jgi:cytochrome P450